MRIPIDKDEWYPVYTVYERPGPSFYVEADVSCVDRWKRVTAEFEAVQKEIANLAHIDA